MRFLPCLPLWLALCLSCQLSAQHCAFDHSAIYLLNIRAEDDSTVIPNLTITVLDSFGIPLKEFRNIDNEWQEVKMQFWQNPLKTTHVGYIDNNNPALSGKIRFWFAKNYYTLLHYYRLPIRRIKIEDTDGLENGGHFKTKIIKFDKDYTYRLCSYFGNWRNGNREQLKDFYKPVEVVLKRY